MILGYMETTFPKNSKGAKPGVMTYDFHKSKLEVGLIAWIVFIHLIALLAPFTFTWEGLISFFVMYCLTLGLGVTLGYHRLLAHRSFQTPRLVRYGLTVLACLALQGGPIHWVATHRLHHRTADTPNDPHTPTRGFFWSHVAWIFYRIPNLHTEDELRYYAPDLYQDAGLRLLDRYAFHLYGVFVVLVFVIGTAIGGWQLGASLFIWGCVLRTVCTWHATWLVNSATHRWGYRSYPSDDNSRNNWWVSLLTFGEGWHNNHHAHPYSARMGLKWFEIDLTYLTIQVMQKLHLASHVKHPHPLVHQRNVISPESI